MATSTAKLDVSLLDFDGIKTSLRDFLRNQTEFKDYNFEGAGLSVLLDILSYNTHYLAFYLSMIANEMFLDSANMRSSVVSLAKHLNYTPRSITAAEAIVQIVITPDDDSAAAVIQKGTSFVSAIDGATYNYVTDAAYGATIGSDGKYTFPAVTLVQGLPYTYRITVDDSILNQRFVLPNAGIDTKRLTVRVQRSITDTTLTTFSLAQSFLQLTSTTPAYFVQEVSNQLYEVYFGDGIIGTDVVDGNIIIIDYILTQGTAGNSALIFTPSMTVAGYQVQLTQVTTLVTGAGGLDPETIDEIKFAAPKNYTVQDRAVTASDYKVLLTQDYTNLDSVAVWGGEDNVPPQYGKVFISLKPVPGYVVTENTKALVIQNIIKSKNVVSVIPDIIDPDYIFIIVNCSVKYNPANTARTNGDIQSAAYSAIIDFAVTNLDKFYQELRYSNLLTAIDESDSSITNNSTSLQMKKVFTPRLEVVTNYDFNMNNAILPGSLTSSSFITVHDTKLTLTYADGKTYTIADDGLGNVNLIQHGIGITDTPVRQCGTVNYATGEIMIEQLIPFTADVNGNISLIMQPQENDIIPVRNNILFIQPSDVTVVAVPVATLQS